MSRHMKVDLLLLVAMSLLLAACAGDPPGDAAAPSSTGETSSEVTPSETTSGTTSPMLGGWTPIPEDAEGVIPAGRSGMTANGRPDAPWAVLDIPNGFSSLGGWVIFDEKRGGGVGYWTVSEVVRHPCNPFRDSNAIDAGNTVEDLVAAFQQQRLTRMTAPTPATVDGYDGVSIGVRPPKGYTLADCGDYNVWESDPAGARHMQSSGAFDRLWILDVEDEVVVLTVTTDGDASKASLDDLTKMVESVDFVAR